MSYKVRRIIIISILVIVGIIHFAVKPHLHRQAAVKTVTTILEGWQGDDLVRAMHLWENPDEFPPIYGVTSYEILQADFHREEKVYYAEIIVTMDFEGGNIFPSKKRWSFTLKDKRFGWKVERFLILDKNAPVKFHR